MKTTVCSGTSNRRPEGVTIAIFFSLLLFTSCQKNESILNPFESPEGIDMMTIPDLSSDCVAKNMTIYYGHKIFRRGHGAPVVETVIMENPSFSCFNGKFILKIRNGWDRRSRVSSAEIWIDGKLVVRPSDFNKNAFLIIKYITGLTPESKLEVKLNGTPGSYIDLWIEGTMTKVTPVFEQIGPVCQYSDPPILPVSSLNEPPVTGSWNPQQISTATAGKTTYTFTPDEGQCGSVVRMEVEVMPSVIPAFEQIGPLAQGSVPPALPLTSTNGISGTWNPDKINTATAGDITYTFTPAAGQCAVTSQLVITVKEPEAISDIDGNIYKIVKIGDQWWMAENLKTTRYNNGDPIGTTTPASLDISGQAEPKYQWAYSGDENNVAIYGRLYTWYTVTDSRGVCPGGWHIPSDAEWIKLTDYLIDSGYGYEGSGPDIAKSLASTSGWRIFEIPGYPGNKQEENNKSNFNALPSGYRFSNGNFVNIDDYASWWSNYKRDFIIADFWSLHYNRNYIKREYSDMKQGNAVRCLKDD